MKTITLLFTLLTIASHAQKTTRTTIAEHKGIIINLLLTEAGDSTYLMMAQNAKYTHIVDIIVLKSGRLQEITALLEECRKMMPEKDGTSLNYEGNLIATFNKGRIMLYGSGDDKNGYVLLNEPTVEKLMASLK